MFILVVQHPHIEVLAGVGLEHLHLRRQRLVGGEEVTIDDAHDFQIGATGRPLISVDMPHAEVQVGGGIPQPTITQSQVYGLHRNNLG